MGDCACVQILQVPGLPRIVQSAESTTDTRQCFSVTLKIIYTCLEFGDEGYNQISYI